VTEERDAANADPAGAWLDRVLREELQREALPDDGFTDSVLRALPPAVQSDQAPAGPRPWARHWASLLVLGGLGGVLVLLFSWWPGLVAALLQATSPGSEVLATGPSAQRWVPSVALLGLLIWWSWWWSAQASE
jgi:hypothetical protein